ncbi:MAG: type II secretion system protein, partial [Verrucomicrobiota bacterium]
MKMKINLKKSYSKGLTLIELLVVLVILTIIASMTVVGLARMKEAAEQAEHVTYLREIALATISYATDNGNRLPSPEYPGGMGDDYDDGGDDCPEHAFFASSSGLWLDGVIYHWMYYESEARGGRADESNAAFQAAMDKAAQEGPDNIDGENGRHLEGTHFGSKRSYKKNPEEEDWHYHSYAMNANLAP